MPLIDAILPEFDQEMKTTRSLLERVPDDDPEWRPHPKSTAIGALAMHIANLPVWGSSAMTETSFDAKNPPPEIAKALREPFQSSAGLLERFDKNVAEARHTIKQSTDESLMVPWSLMAGSHTIFSIPRAGVIRSFVINHIIHHRGQLSVYLRLRDIPLPSIYGPTADTPAGFGADS